MSANLQELIQRIVAGSRDEADIQAIVAALQAGHLTLVTGDNAVGIAGDATNAIIITGSNNILVQGQVAESLQAILEQVHLVQPMPTASVDELVQQVRSLFHDDIQRLHSTMPLWGVDHWVPLGELFVDVNVLEELSSSHRAELDDLWQDFTTGMQGYSSYHSLDRIGLGKGRQRVSGLEILAKNTNLMVVGKPGSGKTTYLQRVVTEYNAENLQSRRIPVLIKLREFIDNGRSLSYSLEQYLERYWKLSTVETRLVLSQGRSLVLLDGLDEVTGDDGKAITQQIKQFAHTYPQVQMVVTCRTQSFTGEMDWKSLRFSFVEVADFNEPQVRLFSEHWFKTVMQDEVQGLTKSQEFLNQLFREENKLIRELTTTPILLSLTCAVFHQTGKFYSKRSKLYEEGLELLLEQWDKSREIERDEIYRDLLVERKLELLSYLAVKKFEQEQYVLFEQAEIEDYISEFLGIGRRESRAVLKAIESQHGLLIERSQKVWSFSHLTFQEYFAAKWFCHRYKLWKELVCYVKEKQWREVFLLTTGMLQNADELMQLMKTQVDGLLAGEETLQLLLKQMQETINSMNSPYKPAAIRALCLVFALDHDFIHLVMMDWSRAISRSLANIPPFDILYESTGILSTVRHLISWLDVALHHVPPPPRRIFAHVVDPKLKYHLEQLQTPVKFERSQEELKQWLQHDSQTWIEEVQAFAGSVSGHNLKFDERQKQLLQQYYGANDLLVDCLNSNCYVSREVRQEIEETLLLPIIEVEKHKREKVE